MRLCMKAGGSLLAVAVAVLAFGNWKSSPLHRYMCGSNAPYTSNIRWLVEGPRTIDNWPARLCNCTPPQGFAEHEAKVGFHWVNGHLRFLGSDTNAGAVKLRDNPKIQLLVRYRFVVARRE